VRRLAAAACVAIVAGACGGGGPPPPTETVRFTAEDGVELVGDLRGEGETGVVLAHMFPDDRTSWSGLAERLAGEGYRTLAFDFRGYGDSGGQRELSALPLDVAAAAAFLRERGARRVVLVGASMGGTASLIVASREEVDGVITLSAPITFMGLEIETGELGLITEPKLFIAAQEDAAAGTAQRLYERSISPKRVEILTGGGHGTELLHGRQAETVVSLVLTFLGRGA
jgi:pimeloyl-ACP methyl ester carboxylesterase